MLTTGITLGLMTGIGFFLLYRKLPGRLKKFMCKHILFTDALACALTYCLFGGTIIGLFAAAFCGIAISIVLNLVNRKEVNELLEKTYQQSSELWRELTGNGEEKTLPRQLEVVK